MKTEAPTESKLEGLREEGFVPFSPLASHSFGIAGAGFALVLSMKKITFRWPNDCHFLIDSACASYVDSLKQLGMVPIILLLTYSLLYLATTLVQTRGYFRFQFTRTFFGDSVTRHSALGYLCSLIIVLGFICFAVTAAPQQVVTTIRMAQQSHAEGVLRSLARSIYIFSTFCAIFGGMAWLIARLLFLREHRMTRAEIMQEGK